MTSEVLSRRDFLIYGGGTVTGITLGELGRRALARADEGAAGWRERGEESWASTVCRECPAACGVRVRLIDRVPVKLEGNPLCPVSRGRLCAKGQAALEGHFDPDRLIGPARRAGKRGENRWEPISWDEAVRLLASGLRMKPGGSEAGLAVAEEEHGPLADAWARFFMAAGARVTWTPAAAAARLAPRLGALTGAETQPIFDLEHASYVLSFGAPVVEDWLSPVWAQRSYGRFRRGASRSRGRLVQVETRRSLTARKADEWLPVRAQGQAMLAYGLAYVLLRENRVDRTFLDELGGDLAGFEREIVAHHTPDDVAAATGVPVVTVLRLARELAGSPEALVVVGADAEPSLVDAVFALNALLGAFDRRGGISGSLPGPADELDDAIAVLRDVASGRLQPRFLALRDASALRRLDSPAELGAGLAKTDLVVSFSPYLDEAASLADLLLPTHTALESWHVVRPAQAAALEAVALAKPAVRPRLDTKDAANLLKLAADAIGGHVAEACNWTNSENLAAAELDRLWGLRRGAPYADTHETEWVRQLERGGWWAAPAASRDDFAEAVARAGGWVDPLVALGQIRESLRTRGGLTFPAPAAAISRAAVARAPVDSSPAEYPLLLVPFTPALVGGSGSPNQPVLFELLGQPDGAPWQPWAEISPETARALSIQPGARIRISSPQGSVEACAVLVEKMSAAVVALAFVPSVPSGGRWAREVPGDLRRLWGKDGFSGSCAVRVSQV